MGEGAITSPNPSALPPADSEAAMRRTQAGTGRFPTASVRFNRREREILALLCRGEGDKEIAAVLEVDPGTARYHLRHLREKAGVNSDCELILYAMQQPQAMTPGAECRPGLHAPGSDSCPYCTALAVA
jgi:DNA-binding CsgD family transcriptional regulator